MRQYICLAKTHTPFYNSIINPNVNKSFTERLEQIGFKGDIPNIFLDPVTMILMNNPMLTSDSYTYDAETIKKLNNISPFTKSKFKVIEENLLLRSRIEDFVSAQEYLAVQ